MKIVKGRVFVLTSISLMVIGCQKSVLTPDSSSVRNLTNQSVENQSLFGEYSFETQADGLLGMTRKSLDPNKFGHANINYEKPIKKEDRTPEKIHTKLKEKLAQSDPNKIVKVIINYRDNVKIPVFPILKQKDALPDSTLPNFSIQTDSLVASIVAERAGEYKRVSDEIASKYNGKVVETFWLINAVVAEIPLGRINSIASSPDVLNITEANLVERAPTTVADGRTAMGTDALKAWISFQYTTPIGLVDTGVTGPAPHVLLNQYMIKKDCIGSSSCSGSNPYENYLCNHGTSSAAIIAGNGNLGNDTLGVFNRTIYSYKEGVVAQDANGPYCGTEYQATIYGIQRAVADGMGVIVVETQFDGSPSDSLSTAANNAFDAGRAVIAANGNYNTNGTPGTVRYPAGAHKVLGVGAVNLPGGDIPSYQSIGPTSDGRVKPDVQAPTCATTASGKDSYGNSSTTALRVFCGTSGSTPFAGGAAAIMYDYMHYSFAQVNMALPAFVYANLIASGTNASGAYNNTTGAGQIKFPTNRYSVIGGGTFNLTSNGDYYDCTIGISNAYFPGKKIKSAIWWAESPSMPHSDIDIQLISPNGTVLVSSTSVSSVFEKLEYSNGEQLPDGDYKLRVSAYSVKSFPLIACANIVEN